MSDWWVSLSNKRECHETKLLWTAILVQKKSSELSLYTIFSLSLLREINYSKKEHGNSNHHRSVKQNSHSIIVQILLVIKKKTLFITFWLWIHWTSTIKKQFNIDLMPQRLWLINIADSLSNISNYRFKSNKLDAWPHNPKES